MHVVVRARCLPTSIASLSLPRKAQSKVSSGKLFRGPVGLSGRFQGICNFGNRAPLINHHLGIITKETDPYSRKLQLKRPMMSGQLQHIASVFFIGGSVGCATVHTVGATGRLMSEAFLDVSVFMTT